MDTEPVSGYRWTECAAGHRSVDGEIVRFLDRPGEMCGRCRWEEGERERVAGIEADALWAIEVAGRLGDPGIASGLLAAKRDRGEGCGVKDS